MAISPEEIGRRMMSTAGTLDDDAEFNSWAKLGSKLVSMGSVFSPKSIGDLSTEEQQVLSRALNRLKQQASKVA